MKIFTEIVFDGTVKGTTEVFSSAQFDELLGKPDEICYEVEVEESSGTTPTISVAHYHSNSGKGHIATTASPLVSAADISSPPYRSVVQQSGQTLGARGRVGVKLLGTTPTARVRIWATGRSK